METERRGTCLAVRGGSIVGIAAGLMVASAVGGASMELVLAVVAAAVVANTAGAVLVQLPAITIAVRARTPGYIVERGSTEAMFESPHASRAFVGRAGTRRKRPP